MKISVHSNIREIELDWRAFQANAAGTFYQTFEWCSAWIETAGQAEGIQACIVTGVTLDGKLQFLLPFALRNAGGVRILEWIGSRQINYGYGLYERSFLSVARDWFQSEGWQILRIIDSVDAIRLREIPEKLHGHPHPLIGWRTVPSANKSYVMSLSNDYEGIYAVKRSSETRRGNRKRDAKLESLGRIDFGLPDSRERSHVLLDQMFKHQESRLAESGIKGVFDELDRAFIHRLADFDDTLLPYHLNIDGELTAMMLGGSYDNTFWALISSLNSGVARRYSPGDAALRRMIEACCKSGLRSLDFSSGDTAYKLHWADEAIPLHEAIHFITLKGAIWCLGAYAVALTKRLVKQSPTSWSIYTALRMRLHGEKRE